MKTRPDHRFAGQRGVASLIVVMVLLFVVAMVAAYTSRNLIFEQRTSANQYRSTQALEAAEAGLEWAITLLNQGRIDANCAASTNTADTTFRQRYVTIDRNTGLVSIPSGAGSPVATSAYPTCVWTGSAWSCSCPTNTTPTLAAPTDGLIHPAFRVRFLTDTKTQSRPGLMRVEVNGCTALNETCLQFPTAAGVVEEGRAKVNALVVLTGGLPAPPKAAVTALGDVNVPGLTVYNTDPSTGVAVQSGGAISVGTTVGPPGSMSAAVLPNDPGLQSPMTAARMVYALFNMYPDTYRLQPAAVVLSCGGTPCTASALRSAASLNPGRVFWVDGDLDLDSAGAIGTSTDPAMVYVNGNVTISNASATLNGVIFSNAATWSLSGSGTVVGAIVAANGLSGSSTGTVVYDAGIVANLRYASGSFVRVPGGWKDF